MGVGVIDDVGVVDADDVVVELAGSGEGGREDVARGDKRAEHKERKGR